MRPLCLAACLLTALSACSAPHPLPDTLTPPPGKALVYIIRPKRFTTPLPMRILKNPVLFYVAPYAVFFNLASYEVYYDETISTGFLTGRRYIYRFIDPGTHTFYTYAQSGRLSKYSNDLDLLLAPGKTYYLRLDMRSGWMGILARPQLKFLNAAEGRKLLRKRRLSKYNEVSNFNIPPCAPSTR